MGSVSQQSHCPSKQCHLGVAHTMWVPQAAPTALIATERMMLGDSNEIMLLSYFIHNTNSIVRNIHDGKVCQLQSPLTQHQRWCSLLTAEAQS